MQIIYHIGEKIGVETIVVKGLLTEDIAPLIKPCAN